MQSVYGGRRSGIGKSAMQATPQRLSGLRLAAVQWLALAFGAVLPLLAPAQTNYVYDANGRLVGVTSASGQSVRYVYDDNGNRVRTDTLPATQLALFGFSPEHGAPGSTVLLSGQGFSSTASANAVRFNGVTADVLSATVNALEVTVPANATSGPISVTAGGVTATSQTPFVVDGTGLPPTLASVSPLLGAAGTVVTLTGEHLDPVPGATTVTLNGVAVVPTTITDTTISFAIPKTFGSGRFQVTTPYGQATAASDFMTIPADYKNNYAITSSRLVVGGVAAPVTAASSSDVKEFVFDAVADTWVTLQAVGIVNTASLQLYDPRGFVLGEQLFISQSRPSAHFLQLPMTGTYTLVVWPMGAAGFNVNLERDGQILLDSPYVFATAQNGESERLMFKADAGESFGIGLLNPQTSSAGSTIRTELLDANGQSLSYENCEPGQSTPVCDLNAPGFQVSPYLASLPPAGWRQLVLTSEQGSTSTANVLLTRDVTQTITPNVSATIQLPNSGQNGEQIFQGAAGQYVSLVPNAIATTPSNATVYYAMYDPDGDLVAHDSFYIGSTVNFPRLGKSGNYSIYIDPYMGAQASINDTLLIDSAVYANVNGPAVSVSATVRNQNAYVLFEAVQGSSYTVSANCVADGGYVGIYIKGPSGSNVGASGGCGSYNNGAILNNAPQSGIYTVVMSGDKPFSADVSVTQP